MKYELIKEFRKKMYQKMKYHLVDSGKTKFITNNIMLDPDFPFIHLGKINVKNWSSKTMLGLKLSLPITIFSKNPSSEELDEISKNAAECLDDWESRIESKYLTRTKIISSDNDYLPKRQVYRNILQIQTSIEELENE